MDHVPQISANDCLLFGDLCFVLESHEVFCAVLFVLLNSLILLDKLQWDSMICRSSMLQLKVYDPHHKRGLCRRWAGLTQFCRAGFVTWIILRVEGNGLTFAHTGQTAYNFLWNCKEHWYVFRSLWQFAGSNIVRSRRSKQFHVCLGALMLRAGRNHLWCMAHSHPRGHFRDSVGLVGKHSKKSKLRSNYYTNIIRIFILYVTVYHLCM